jgi:hypothetical protein
MEKRMTVTLIQRMLRWARCGVGLTSSDSSAHFLWNLGTFMSQQQIMVAVLLVVIASIYNYQTGKLSDAALRDNLWATLFPYICIVCLFGVYYTFKAARDVQRQLSSEWKADRPKIYITGDAATSPVRARPSLMPAVITSTILVSVFGLLSYLSFHIAFKSRIRIVPTPSFVYIAPGVWSPAPRNLWLMLIRHYGPEPVNNIEIVFVDKDRQNAISKKESATEQEIRGEQVTLHFPEIDPTEGFWAKTFPWAPLDPDHEHFEIVEVCREGRFSEKLDIERVNKAWVWSMTVTDQLAKRVLIHCRDPFFPLRDHATDNVKRCFPEYTIKHMGVESQ